MALKISKNQGLTDVITAANPLQTQHVNTGEAKATRVFLFNDAAANKYESVVIKAKDTSGTDESSWVQFAPDNSGTAGSYSSTLNMANISDNNVAKPFWVRVTNPSGTVALNKTDLSIEVTANEFAV